MRKLAPLALVAMLVGCTCSKIEEPPPTKANLAPTPASASASANGADEGPEPPLDLESLPVEEDYEVEAEKAITPKNLLEKVDELDQEIPAN